MRAMGIQESKIPLTEEVSLYTKLRSNVVDLQEYMSLEKSSKTKRSWPVR